MDRDALKRELTEQFHQSLDQPMDAVQRAPNGAWIAGSEWEVRAAFQRLTAQAFERSLQAKMDAAEVKPAVFPPVEGVGPQNKGSRGLDVLTAGGEVRLNRGYFWSGKAGGSCPADALLGVEKSNITPGARQLCCLMAIGQDFDQAGADLLKVGGLPVSREKLRQVTQDEGKAVREVRDEGKLPAAWTAPQAKLPDGRSRVYGGVDGVMALTVTQVEKDKRRQQHITRRQQRGKAGLVHCHTTKLG